jgi:hypothetical protein
MLRSMSDAPWHSGLRNSKEWTNNNKSHQIAHNAKMKEQHDVAARYTTSHCTTTAAQIRTTM